MADVFRLDIRQTDEDILNENNRERFSTVKVPDNPSMMELKVQLPIAYDGPKGENGLEKVYTPEHFFLAGVSSCFFTTFSVVSSNSNMKYKRLQIEAKGTIGVSTGTKMMEKIEQKITLMVPSNVNQKKALKVLELTEKRCPLANSVKARVENTYNVVVD